jgi:hypothetical protein
VADTIVTAVALVVCVVCLCVIAWARTHPVERKDEAMENYRKLIDAQRAKDD